MKTKKTRRKAAVQITAAKLNKLKADMAAQSTVAPALPSHRAMNLVESVLAHAGSSKKGDAGDRQRVIAANILDAALRIDRAYAEANGISKGTAETERAIVEGIMARIGMNSLMKPNPRTIVLSFNEAKVLKKALDEAGYSDGIPRAARMAWQQVTDDDLHRSLDQGQTFHFEDRSPVAKAA
jgi:hypothetical protein